ncbi:MAG: hypothetical protein J7J87_05340 [Candidatus Diapherotrites archaeon]|nr:hypothetical protein [Candidatus Diapherotrites archaeon]
MLDTASFFDLGKNKSLRNTIILILCAEWPLTVSQIYKRLLRSYGVSCTYQAVFKQVKELASDGLLIMDENGYRINERWLLTLNKFILGVLERYKENPQGVLGQKLLEEKVPGRY